MELYREEEKHGEESAQELKAGGTTVSNLTQYRDRA